MIQKRGVCLPECILREGEATKLSVLLLIRLNEGIFTLLLRLRNIFQNSHLFQSFSSK